MKLIINHKYDARLYVIQIEDFNGLLTATALSLKEKKDNYVLIFKNEVCCHQTHKLIRTIVHIATEIHVFMQMYNIRQNAGVRNGMILNLFID